ncbi:Colicin V production protein [Aquisphaera giovannonii]|uniref:Colicin V production protein n=1 Tax=Aquisphaera giovannonii TaxID=406548 RepID=A0A5B9WC26_9BACT|nr:CvpA family protein [Aquisphaera giovannonii]QEH37779.1 Colicin V production protein [Aquisphaera giovannonii]
MKIVTDLVISFMIVLMTYVVSSEGLWGAALMFFNVVFSGMIAFNHYEPLARLIDSTGIGWGFSDTLAMLSIFCVSLLIFRMTTETIAPAMVRFPTPVYHAGRLVFALGTSLVLTSIILLSFHAAPVHKRVFGAMDWKYKPPFGMGLDHHWLGFFQYATKEVFPRYDGGGTTVSSGNRGQRVKVRYFDPKARWLLDHQEARPYGTESILDDSGGSGGEAGGGGSPAPPARGGPPS